MPSLGLADLFAASLLLIVAGGISMALSLGLATSLAVAAARMTAQLALAGLVLKHVFERSSPGVTILVGVVMVLVAGYEVKSRQTHDPGGWLTYGLGTSALLIIGSAITIYASLAVIRPEPWYTPRVVLPILGMVLGNTLTSVALALDTLTETARDQRAAIEARLALGVSRSTAMLGPLSRAMKTALMPMVNSMAAAGIVTLPGMMTGQILAGVNPIDAAKYQLSVMFLLAGATALGALAAALMGVVLLTDSRHRLRPTHHGPR